ncbi:MAG TPA: hypothetical protein DCE18_09720 [Syntrophobacteraceae bacterium]|jgi:hypothetical protein|nr:hypothetical protein [Syntrophobacteraceae bacterium]
MASKTVETPKTFKVTPEFETWLGRALLDIGCSLTDLVKTCLILSVPSVTAKPSIVQKFKEEGFDPHG